MPVKLSRFVRVMSGGLVVTDELVTVRDQKAGAALDELQAQIDRLGAAGLRIPALEDTHRDLTTARVDANAQTSNADKCAALEGVKFDARDAAADAGQQVDAALVTAADKTTKLGEVNTALNAAQAAVAGIPDAALRAPLEPRVDPLKARRDTLAGATELAAAAAELAKAPALLIDIGQLASDAGTVDAVARAKAAKLGEVDTALGALRTSVAGVAGVGFKDPVAAPIAGLATRRDTLAGAADLVSARAEIANAGALLADIGTAKTAADRAAKAEQDQAAQLGLVNTALSALTTEEGSITVPVLKAPITLSIPPLANRRDALAGAADTAAAEAQVALAPALLADIGTARTAAQQAVRNAAALVRRKAGIDSCISAADNWIRSLKPGTETTALQARQSTLKTDRTALDTAPATSLAGSLTALETASRSLYDDARSESAAQKKASADLWVAAFKKWETAIGKISASNPVTGETATLRLEKQAAEAQAEVGARRSALVTFITNAAALQTKVEGMQALKTEIEKAGMTVAALLTMKPPPTPPPTALAGERATVLAALPGAFNQAGTDAVMTRLGALKVDMLAIKPKAEDWRAGQLDLTKLKASVAKSLTDAGAAIGTLAGGTEKNDLQSELAALSLRKTGADGMAEAEAKKALFAVDKDALALLERSHKQSFSAQLAAPDGKQKIDDLIKALGDKAADPQAEAVCRAALAARFKLDVEVLEGLSVDRLPRLYNLFAQVPEAHVGHDKLTKLQYNTDPGADASYYSGSGTKIVLVMGESDSTYPYKAQTGGAVENLNYFSATALHEIGHGVDAKQDIMSESRMATAEFGGWKKETIDSVAQAHYTQSFASFKADGGPTEADLLALVKSVLETGDCKKPASATAALGSLFGTWTEISASQGFKDCKAIRNPGVSPWNKAVPVGGRAYHEGYDGSWFSYLTAERAKGISNYQWRAPPEWFAEWYAYYHMTKKAIPAGLDAYVKA